MIVVIKNFFSYEHDNIARGYIHPPPHTYTNWFCEKRGKGKIFQEKYFIFIINQSHIK